MAVVERIFRAMGTDCHVLVVAPEPVADELAALAVERVGLLEECWSRFRPTSELSALNSTAGTGPRAVSGDLYLLVERMREAWQLSGGLFDPTVLTSMRTLGYDADLATVQARTATMTLGDVVLASAPGMSGVVLDEARRTVALPSNVGIDPGAIGKGLAADLVADDLMAAGATGVLVNLGGDLRVAGSPPDGSPWTIGVEDERLPTDHPDRVARLLEFADGTRDAGIATSTKLKRRWAQGRRHHVIDPRTGTMGASDLLQVTVVAGSAWEAEVTATTALLMTADEATAWLRSADRTAVLITADRIILTDDEGHHG